MTGFWIDTEGGEYVLRDDWDAADPGRAIARFSDEKDAAEALERVTRFQLFLGRQDISALRTWDKMEGRYTRP